MCMVFYLSAKELTSLMTHAWHDISPGEDLPQEFSVP